MRQRRWNLAWVAVIAVVGVTLGALVLIPLLRGDADGTEGSLVGEPAPAIEATDLAGRT